MADVTRVQHIFEIVENGVMFRDALYFSLEEWEQKTEEELNQLKNQRHENYKKTKEEIKKQNTINSEELLEEGVEEKV